MKISIFIICSVISFLGFLYPLVLLIAGLVERDPIILILFFSCIYAWYCYFIMGVAWVKKQKIDKWYPLSGTVSALINPITFSFGQNTFPESLSFFDMFIPVLPAVLLACWFVYFHLGETPTHH